MTSHLYRSGRWVRCAECDALITPRSEPDGVIIGSVSVWYDRWVPGYGREKGFEYVPAPVCTRSWEEQNPGRVPHRVIWDRFNELLDA